MREEGGGGGLADGSILDTIVDCKKGARVRFSSEAREPHAQWRKKTRESRNIKTGHLFFEKQNILSQTIT